MTTGVAKPGSRYDQTRLLFTPATMRWPVTQTKVRRNAKQFLPHYITVRKNNSPQMGTPGTWSPSIHPWLECDMGVHPRHMVPLYTPVVRM